MRFSKKSQKRMKRKVKKQSRSINRYSTARGGIRM